MARGMARLAATAKTVNGAVESGPAMASRKGPKTAATSPAPTATVVARRPSRPFRAAASKATAQVSGATAAARRPVAAWAAASDGPRTSMPAAARNPGSGCQRSKAGRGTVSGPAA
jgi:hypothetical protein